MIEINDGQPRDPVISVVAYPELPVKDSLKEPHDDICQFLLSRQYKW